MDDFKTTRDQTVRQPHRTRTIHELAAFFYLLANFFHSLDWRLAFQLKTVNYNTFQHTFTFIILCELCATNSDCFGDEYRSKW